MKKTIDTDVAIIGAGLTGLTLAFYLKKAGKKVVLIDKNSKPGGVIQTHSENGFLYESGPNTGVLSSPELIALFEDLGNSCQPETANPNAKHRWIWKNDRWHALPEGLISGISTPLFSWNDKFRILKEPWVKKGSDPYESVANLVRRRMGKSFLDYAVDPFISGIYAGNPENLVTRFALPKLYWLEQDYGSFIRGGIKKKREPKTAAEQKVSREVFSVAGGLKNLILALVAEIGEENILLECTNTNASIRNKAFVTSVVLADNTVLEMESKHLVSTAGSYQLPELLPFIPKETMDQLTMLNYAKVVQVMAGYNTWNGIPLKAFGGLIPSRENRDVLGMLFPSSIFNGRAPENGALLSVFMGGERNPQLIDKSDEEIREIALKKIQESMRLTDGEPDLFKIFRYPKAIPQYEKSSEMRLMAIQKAEEAFPGLIIAGNIRDGIGMADRVKQAVTIFNSLTNN